MGYDYAHGKGSSGGVSEGMSVGIMSGGTSGLELNFRQGEVAIAMAAMVAAAAEASSVAVTAFNRGVNIREERGERGVEDNSLPQLKRK